MGMIDDVETIAVVRYECDDCGTESDEWETPDNENVLKASLTEQGWTFDGDECYCPECKPPEEIDGD